jgi:hypothetical protein
LFDIPLVAGLKGFSPRMMPSACDNITFFNQSSDRGHCFIANSFKLAIQYSKKLFLPRFQCYIIKFSGE